MMMSVYSAGWLINVEQLVECEFAEETEVLWENPPHCNFVNHQSHIKHPQTTPKPPQWEVFPLTTWATLCGKNELHKNYEALRFYVFPLKWFILPDPWRTC
jgi:hypothetical protein